MTDILVSAASAPNPESPTFLLIVIASEKPSKNADLAHYKFFFHKNFIWALGPTQLTFEVILIF